MAAPQTSLPASSTWTTTPSTVPAPPPPPPPPPPPARPPSLFSRNLKGSGSKASLFLPPGFTVPPLFTAQEEEELRKRREKREKEREKEEERRKSSSSASPSTSSAPLSSSSPPAPATAPSPPSLTLPRHVGIILDGNTRWARARGLPPRAGHAAGALALSRADRAARGGGELRYWRWRGVLTEYVLVRPEEGSAVPSRGNLLLVHGFGAFGEHYRDVSAALAKMGYTVYAPTLPGYGRSEKVREKEREKGRKREREKLVFIFFPLFSFAKRQNKSKTLFSHPSLQNKNKNSLLPATARASGAPSSPSSPPAW